MIRFALLGAALVLASPVRADCDPRNFPMQNVDLSQTAQSFKLAYLEKISREQYDEMNKKGQLAGTIPGLDISPSMSYEDFERVVRLESESRNLQVSQSQFQSMYRSRISPEGVQAYIACLDKTGVYSDISAPPQADTSDIFILSFVWHGQIGANIGNFDLIGPSPFLITGGDILKNADFYNGLKTVQSGQVLRIPIRRDTKEDFSFVASVNGYSAELDLPKIVPPQVLRYEVKSSGTVSANTDNSNDFADNDRDNCLQAGANEILIPSTARVVDNRWYGEDRGRVWSKILTDPSPNTKSICYRIHSHTSNRQQGAFIESHVEAVAVILPGH